MTNQTDRELIQYLVNELQGYRVAHPDHEMPALEAGRTRLAQPGPVGPTDEEIDDQFFAHCYTDDFGNELMEIQQFRKSARAVLARFGRPAIKPEPQGPTDEEIDALVICIQGLPVPDADDLALPSIDRGRDMVRKALARWGGPAITPVPVAERPVLTDLSEET